MHALDSDTRARNLHKFLSKFLHLCVDEHYSSKMTSTYNHENLLENLRKFIVRMSSILDFCNSNTYLLATREHHSGFITSDIMHVR